MPPKKNPVKPKGKMTAYAFFVNACRLEHHNQFPGQKIKLSEFSTVCAKRWKEMTMDQKRPFAEMADRDKMRYENELKLLFPGEAQPKRRRKKKDPNAPKKNLSPFFIFSKLKRPEIMKDHPSKGVGDISKVLSVEWAAMSDEEKSKYIKLSEEDKVRYQKQLEIYKGDTANSADANMMNHDADDDDVMDDEEEEDDEFSFANVGQSQVSAAGGGPSNYQSNMAPSMQQQSMPGGPQNQQFQNSSPNGQAQQMFQQSLVMQQQPQTMAPGSAPQQMQNMVSNMVTPSQTMNSYQSSPVMQQQQQTSQSQHHMPSSNMHGGAVYTSHPQFMNQQQMMTSQSNIQSHQKDMQQAFMNSQQMMGMNSQQQQQPTTQQSQQNQNFGQMPHQMMSQSQQGMGSLQQQQQQPVLQQPQLQQQQITQQNSASLQQCSIPADSRQLQSSPQSDQQMPGQLSGQTVQPNQNQTQANETRTYAADQQSTASVQQTVPTSPSGEGMQQSTPAALPDANSGSTSVKEESPAAPASPSAAGSSGQDAVNPTSDNAASEANPPSEAPASESNPTTDS